MTYFVGAACVVRAATFHGVDGFDPRFFYSMEESDLAWRLLDAGWSIWYSADLKVFHPRTAPSRHAGYARLTARNRLWMAWRSLPAPVLASYLIIWTVAAVVRGAPLREVLSGYREALVGAPDATPDPVADRRSDDLAGPTASGVTSRVRESDPADLRPYDGT